MDYLPQFPDKYFDLAVVDPPYFSGPEKRNCYGRTVSPIGVKRYYKPSAEWNIPDENYFKELARVSKNQIVCGGAIIFNIHSAPEESYGINAMMATTSRIAK